MFIRSVKFEGLRKTGPIAQILVQAHKNDFNIPKTDL